MKTLVLVNDPPYGSERSYNALQLDELIEGTKRSTLEELTEWTVWAEKVLVF